MTRTAPPRTPPPHSVEISENSGADSGITEAGDGPLGGLRARTRRWVGVPLLRDLLILAGFGAFAIWLTHGLLADPTGRALAQNPDDQTLYEWFLTYDTKIWSGGFHLVTDRLNAPFGVNLLANTTVIALGAVFTPVTLAYGAATTFAVIVAVNLAATAAAWYFLFTRTLRASRPASVAGAALCGFAPGMISQSNAHLHITAQWLVPAIVWAVVRMWRAAVADDRRRTATSGVALALLVCLQVLIGEETLFLTALTLLFVAGAYAWVTKPGRPLIARFGRGIGVAAGVAVVLLAYPLWMQFHGPQAVPDGPFSPYYFYADLASFPAFSPLSIAGSADSASLSTGYTELNTFFGWPLLLVTTAATVWLRRNPVALASGIGALVMALFSLGPRIVVAHHNTHVPGPYRLIQGLPVVDGALPMRFALASVPLIALVLVLAWDHARSAAPRPIRGTALGVPVLVLAALVPLTPRPLPTVERAEIPRFYSEGLWRQCAPEGGVIVPVPMATPPEPEPMRYAAATRVAFSMPEGFFIGPYGRWGNASIGIPRRQTSALIDEVTRTGKVRDVNDDDRAIAKHDLAVWQADCVALTDTPNRAALETTLEGLLGPGQTIGDATVWRIS
ncbi:hypothetical protein [Hamadaea tsunoensis]|uniref:hypothetical protein n=1 Tax=Hamadaea tsunoensis TaxID=53368 RepID=UPI000420AE83|nr:hypothetical protein [Hamadaea tsunoensis]